MDPSIGGLIGWDLGAVGTVLLSVAIVQYRQGRLLRDLHEWHSKEDADGVKMWYVRKSLEDAIIQLSEGIAAQNTLMERLVERVSRLDEDFRDLRDRR